MENLNLIISKNLTFLRKKSGLTQIEFGEKFNYTDKTVSRWENGTIIPSVETLKQIADYYGVTVDYLLTDHKSDKEFTTNVNKTFTPKQKFILIALFVTVVWLVASVIYVAAVARLHTTSLQENRYWLAFIWALPLSMVIISVLIFVLFKSRKWSIIFFSAASWAFLLAAFITYLNQDVYWYIFFIGIPIQIGSILVMKLRS